MARGAMENDGAGAPRRKLTAGDVAASLLAALGSGDIVFLAADEARAGQAARARVAARPEAEILYCPGSDALPGDSAPPSAEDVGRRAATLRRLTELVAAPDRLPPVLVSTGEAAARLYPHAGAFGGAPPVVQLGQPVDLEAFAAVLAEIGYVPDERVVSALKPGRLKLPQARRTTSDHLSSLSVNESVVVIRAAR